MRPDSLPGDFLASSGWLLLVCAVLLLFACQGQERPLSPSASFKQEVKSILDMLSATLAEPVAKKDVQGIKTALSKIEPQAVQLCRMCPFQIGILDEHGNTLAVYPLTGENNNFSKYDLVIKTINSKKIQQQKFFLQNGSQLYIICAPILRQDTLVGMMAIAISAEEAKSKWGITEKEFTALNFNP